MKTALLLAGSFAIAIAQDASPTITLGPRSNYNQSPAASATASGNHVEIYPEDFSNGIPDEGITVAFGPDLQASIASTLSGSCADGYSQECSDALNQVLNTDQTYTVESRVVGIDDLLVAGGVALLGLVINAVILYGTDREAVSYVNIPATDLSAIQSQTASTVVIATDTNSVTITAAPTPTVSQASFTTLTADQDDHKSGDIVISLPTAAAQMMEELIYKSDVSEQCVNIQLRKRQSGGGDGGSLQPVNDVANFILPFVPPQQLLAALPRLVNDAQQASLEAAQAFAAGLPEFAGLAADFQNVLAETVWIAALGWCVDQLPDLNELVLQAEDWVEDPKDPGDGEDEGTCPAGAPKGKDAPLCEDDTCAGSDGKCTTDEYKGCKCLSKVIPYWTGGDESYWTDFQFILQGLLSDVGWGCDSENRITLDTKDFDSLASAFCDGVDLTSDVEKTISPSDAGFSGYDEYTFKFSWTTKPDETCMASCTDIYSAFTSTSDCSFNSHTKAMSGYQDFTCGTAMFNITEGEDSSGGEGGSSDDDGVYVNEGNLKCGTHTDQGNANYFTTLETMNKAAEWFCEEQVVKGLRWAPGEVASGDDFVEYHHNSHMYDPMYVSARWIDNAGCPTTDFGGSSAESMNATCREPIGTITNECDTARNDKYWWKQGGTFFRDCVLWNITRDSFQGDQPTATDDWRPERADCASDGDCDGFASESCNGNGAYCVLAADSWCTCKLS